ncbi:ABC transporter permease subunit [Auraticoccus sp. F435]|uniref:ABC transporter permease subunit n=1 Tax=Auraticoccus cholistanensis TaxID=2656650 RepID=A0A6A9UX99_9ACTN|nr:sugar ABC transporter permease [Auraticoccus cholistanensis]MVA75877.1 ABC transporter permease subunit [Auraticoccus cholistanensis]
MGTVASTPVRRVRHRSSSAVALLYLLPALLVFAAFFFLPLGRSIYLSFQRSDLFGRPNGFVGLRNYELLVTSGEFGRILLTTFAFVLLTVVPSMLIGLVLALLLSERIRFVRFFRTAFALPFAYSVATAAVLFGVMMNPATGAFNGLLSLVGLGPVGWLTQPPWALLSVALTSVWMQVGYNLLVLSAGLGAVPDDVLEAARLDGATGWRLQTRIVMPLISPQLFFLAVTGTIQALQSFGQIHILTRGGPDRSTTTLVYSIYDVAFANNNSNFGAGSAQAIVLLLVVLVITGFQFGVLERKVHYS